MRCGARARSSPKCPLRRETTESPQEPFEALEAFSELLGLVAQQGFAQRRRGSALESCAFGEQSCSHRERRGAFGPAARFERLDVITDERHRGAPGDVRQVDASSVGQPAAARREHRAKCAVVDHAQPGDDLRRAHLRELFDDPFE